MCINKNVAQKGKFTLSVCPPACAFGENDLNAVCFTQRNFYVSPEKKSICKAYAIYICMYVVCKENFVLYEYVYSTYRHTHRFCLHGATGDFYVYV
jgi:hypothetical protein